MSRDTFTGSSVLGARGVRTTRKEDSVVVAIPACLLKMLLAWKLMKCGYCSQYSLHD